MGKKSNVLTIIVALIAIINIIFPLVKNWGRFSEKFNPKLYEKKYNKSQYVIPQSKNSISDEELYSYAGYRYATGMNPVLINSDHPPLGKYFIGWITLLTGNQRVVSLLFGFANAVILSVIIYNFTSSLLLVSFGLLLLSFDSMFIDQIIYSPILDLFQVFFILLYFNFYLFWINKKKFIYLILSGLSLGALSSIKMYFPAILAFMVTVLFTLISKKNLKTVFLFALTVFPIALFTYMSTYIVFFMQGNTIRSFFGAQKWIFLYWKDNSVNSSKNWGSLYPFVLFNQWRVWWGSTPYIQYTNWSILWPVVFISGIAGSIYGILQMIKPHKNKLTLAIGLFSLWTISVLTYLSFTPISPRYLLMLFIPIYILILLVIKKRYGDFLS